MTQRDIFRNFRRLIGNPEPSETSERDLVEYIASASDWIADQLRNFYRTEANMIGLVADQREYPLPSDLAWILYVDWGTVPLASSSHFQWSRMGTPYRNTTVPSGTPAEFAMYDRFLILNPPPSSTSLDTADTLTIRYMAAAPEMTAGGVRGLSDLDARLMVARAAWEYLGNHPSDENVARMQFADRMVADLLPGAKSRANTPIEDLRPQFYPLVLRQGSAR